MADLAMKTSGATKAAVRTIEPLTVYATYLPKVHVSSTDIEVTNGDGTWDTHLATKISRQSKRIEKPINPFVPVYGGHT